MDHEKVNILLVDDQPAKLLAYEVILKELDENLVVATSGREALEYLLKNEVAVILVDVCMPELDGFELAAMIREHPRFQKTAMIFISAIQVSDLDRLRAVSRYDLESPDLRARLDDFARQAADRLGTPMGAVSFLFDTAQYFAGMHGIGGWMAEAQGLPIEWSLCATTAKTGCPYVLVDASADPEQSANPVVAVDGIRGYASAPLIGPGGHVLGAVCVADPNAHHFDPGDIAALTALAADVVVDLEARACS